MTSSAQTRSGPDVQVTPRDMRFDTRTAANGPWLGGDVTATAVFNALSLTFPIGERLFIDAVRNYRDRLSGWLLAETKAFIAQEAIHSREHVGLNAGLDRAHYPVEAIDAEMARRFDFLRSRGPVAMLAVTISLEHFTAMMADWFLEDEAFWVGAPEDMTRLWQWHAMEETEHKAVCFDVFLHISRDWSPLQRYIVRTRAMIISTVLFTLNITRFASMLLQADGVPAWRARLGAFNYLFGRPGLFRKSWRAYWDWFRPGFHPWDHDNRRLLETWRPRFQKAETSVAA